MVRAGTVLMALLVVTVAVPTVAVADELPGENEPIAGPGVTFNASDGPALTVGETTEFRNQNPWVSAHNITLEPWGSVTSPGPTAVNVTEFNGTWTQLKEIDASQYRLTIDPNDKEPATVGGNIRRFEYRDNIALDDGIKDFRYGGPSGDATVTLVEVPADTNIAAVDSGTGTVLDAARSNASGAVRFDDLPQSDHDVTLQTYDATAPQMDNSTLSPSGGSAETNPQKVNLSVDISDPDFAVDDSVTAEFYVEGRGSVGTDTLTSNGTAELTISETTAGEYDWYVVARDDYGLSTESKNSTFVIANELTIYNESNASEVVDNATVEVTFYYESGDQSQSVARSTSDGTVNMTGLPATQPLIVSASADGFRNRRIFIESLTQQQRVFLLPDSVQFTRTVFQLKDYTGEFPEDTTVLIVERSLEGSYKTILGDYFGANGQFPAELAYNERHRLMLYNTESGERRNLGTYTPLSTGEQTLAVSATGDVTRVQAPLSFSIRPVAKRLPAQNVSMEFEVDNGSTTVNEYNVTVYKVVNGTNTTVLDTSRNGPGVISATLNLSQAGSGTLKVIHEYRLESGTTGRETDQYAIVGVDGNGLTLLGELGSLLALVPASNVGSFTTALAIIMSLLGTAGVGSRYRLPSEVVGLFGVFILAAFGVIGWLSYDLVFVALVAWGSLTFIRRGFS